MADNRNVRLVEQLHRGESYSQNLLQSGLLTDTTEWWAAGPPDVLPWAGTVKGREAIARWFGLLSEKMKYDVFEPFETISQDDKVVVLYHARGSAKSTGREFRSDVCRIYDFRTGKLARVRNYYDTAAYVNALKAQ